MKDTVTIQELFHAIKKRVLFIILLTFSLVGIAAVLSYFVITPMYEGTSQFIVIQQESENIQLSVTEFETSVELIDTYNEIIKSPFILEKVIDELDLAILPEALEKRIDVTSNENSQVVTISAIAESPEAAATLANTVVEQFQSTIPTIMRIDNVQVLSSAKPSLAQDPIRPRPILNMFIATVIGLMTGVGAALLMEFFSTKVKTEKDLEMMEFIVLGVVSEYQSKGGKNKEMTLVHRRRGEVEE
ncbi:YveK family protein [Salirhabdus sp. Marseille-P4669]|uniref:YveK family protein n=1 Tax=Salirhabdus sp. Marseille-P4669 TaxID=2042310 RepID=UPI001358187A|nr:Wzz/FepE/Etk N-terminal domain-containing protein [Salirhabdus sp. Marseille-P4669]